VLPERRVGAPTAVYVRRRPRGLGMVTLVYGSPERPRLLLSQWRGARYGFLKVLPHGAPAEPVSLGFGVGYWVPRAHAFHYTGPDGAMYEERFYLSAPAQVWAERRVDAVSRSVTTVATASGRLDVHGLAEGGAVVWLADNTNGVLYRLAG
jgi:hypothetical protein